MFTNFKNNFELLFRMLVFFNILKTQLNVFLHLRISKLKHLLFVGTDVSDRRQVLLGR